MNQLDQMYLLFARIFSCFKLKQEQIKKYDQTFEQLENEFDIIYMIKSFRRFNKFIDDYEKQSSKYDE